MYVNITNDEGVVIERYTVRDPSSANPLFSMLEDAMQKARAWIPGELNLHHTDCDVYQSHLAGLPYGEFGCSGGCIADLMDGRADMDDYHSVTVETQEV